MHIQVKLYGDLTKFAPGKESQFDLTLWPGANLGEICSKLGIPHTYPFTALINGRRANIESCPKENDVLVIFPEICGG